MRFPIINLHKKLPHPVQLGVSVKAQTWDPQLLPWRFTDEQHHTTGWGTPARCSVAGEQMEGALLRFSSQAQGKPGEPEEELFAQGSRVGHGLAVKRGKPRSLDSE